MLTCCYCMVILQSSFPHYSMSIMFYIFYLLVHLKEQNSMWRSCQEIVTYTTQGFSKLQLLFIESITQDYSANTSDNCKKMHLYSDMSVK